MSEFMRDSRDITELACEVQEDKRFLSLAVTGIRTASLPRSWEYIDTFFFDHPLGVFIEVTIKILHDTKMEIICLLECKVLIRVTEWSTDVPDTKLSFRIYFGIFRHIFRRS
jgi:hypothetical protein